MTTPSGRRLQAGARGVAHKEQPTADLVEAVRIVASGEVTISPYLAGVTDLFAGKGALPDLTPRQGTIVQARARGERWDSIGSRLFISEPTAKGRLVAVHGKVAS